MVFSPPDSSVRLRVSFPGGRATISIAALQHVLGIEQQYVRPAAAEELAEKLLEIPAHGLESLQEQLAAFLVDLPDQVLQLRLGGIDVSQLVGQEFFALFQFVLLGDGVEVHVAKAVDARFQFANLVLDDVPVAPLVVLIIGEGVLAGFMCMSIRRRGDEVLDPHVASPTSTRRLSRLAGASSCAERCMGQQAADFVDLS